MLSYLHCILALYSACSRPSANAYKRFHGPLNVCAQMTFCFLYGRLTFIIKHGVADSEIQVKAFQNLLGRAEFGEGVQLGMQFHRVDLSKPPFPPGE